MSRSEMQACLARLYTDDSFRRLSYLDRGVTLDHYDLSDAESQAIQAIDPKRLEFFARSLSKKRKAKFARAYTFSFALRPQQANHLWERYHQIHPAHPNRPAQQDLEEFGYFLEESVRYNDRWPPYAAELARYERYRVMVSGRRPVPDVTVDQPISERAGSSSVLDVRPRVIEGVESATFHYDVIRIEDAIARGAPPESDEPSDCFLVFRSAPETPLATEFRVNAASMVVLNLCDGTRPVGDIVATVEQRYGTGGLADAIIHLLDGLHARRLVRFLGDESD